MCVITVLLQVKLSFENIEIILVIACHTTPLNKATRENAITSPALKHRSGSAQAL